MMEVIETGPELHDIAMMHVAKFYAVHGYTDTDEAFEQSDCKDLYGFTRMHEALSKEECKRWVGHGIDKYVAVTRRGFSMLCLWQKDGSPEGAICRALIRKMLAYAAELCRCEALCWSRETEHRARCLEFAQLIDDLIYHIDNPS